MKLLRKIIGSNADNFTAEIEETSSSFFLFRSGDADTKVFVLYSEIDELIAFLEEIKEEDENPTK